MSITKPFLQFAVPTWNRQREVEVCIRSIAEQCKDQVRSVKIFVQDDCSTDGTKASIEALQREYPDLIEYRCTEGRVDYSVAFQSLFAHADAEWVWTFGDDDMLLPGSLDRMMKVLTETDCEFIHCVERGRESGGGKMFRGKLLALCNTFGWLDMTGFITGNIARGHVWNECAESPHWRQYAKSAFVQSCVLLENLKDAQCALMDIPLIATQNESQSQDCVNRWTADRIGERYLRMADCVELMFDERILTDKVKRPFFRYTNYHLWDRHIEYFVNDYIKNAIIQRSDYWGSQSKLANFIEGDELAQSIRNEIDTIGGMISLHAYLVTLAENIKLDIQKAGDTHSESYYPWSIVIPKDALR